MILTELDYEWLTGWHGVKGAAYNQVYEFLLENGFIMRDGLCTPKGKAALDLYEQMNGMV